MLNVKEITSQINQINDVEDLKYLYNYTFNRIQGFRDITIKKATLNFVVGDKAKIKDTYLNRGKICHLRGKIGEVVKVNNKTIKVKFDSVTWTITSTMIDKV